MILRFPLLLRQLLSLLACAALLPAPAEAQQPAAPATAPAAAGPDLVITADGQQRPGRVLGVSGTNLQIQVGQGTMGLALASIKEVRMAVPPEVAQAIKAFQERDYKKVQVLLKSLEKWKGLPPEWAQGVTAMFGDVQAELGDMVKAEAAYKEFQRLYPSAQGSAQAEVGMARLAVGRKEFATAKAKLDPVATKALGEKNFNRELGRAYSQTFYLLGQIAESEGKNEEALEHYLRTVTLFYHDAPTVALAQEKADALRAQKVTVP